MSALDSYYSFKFIFLLTQKWEDTDAFKLGIISEDGTQLKKLRELRSQEEKQAFTRFHKLVYNLKKIIEKAPFGKSAAARYASAILLIKEETGYSFDEELQECLQEFVGIGGVDMGAGSGNLPLNRRNHGVDFEEDVGDDMFAGDAIFDCDSDAFKNCRLGKKKYLKYKNFVGESEQGERIRAYSRKHPKKAVILRDSKTGAMLYLRRKGGA